MIENVFRFLKKKARLIVIKYIIKIDIYCVFKKLETRNPAINKTSHYHILYF